MNLEALISALVHGRAKGGIEAGPEPRPGSPGFEDWLQQAAEPVPPLPDQREMGAAPLTPAHSTENTLDHRVSRRAADLTPAASEGAIAFAERPLLVETSLQFGADTPGLSPRPSDIRWIGEVMQYRIADLLHGRIGDGHGDVSLRSLAPVPAHSGDQRANPADKRSPIFSILPISQGAVENSALPAAEGDGAAEGARPAAGRRDQTAGALAARLMEHFGRVNPNGPLVHLQPEQDGLWRLFLRLPKLPESALTELGAELKSLMNIFGLKLGTFEIVETPNREAR
jgi:hypothetical protein